MADRAVVVDTRDPRSLGRIKVMIPSRLGKNVTDWIWPMGGSNRMYLPAPGTQVFVLYEADDPDYPVWIPTTDSLSTEIQDLKNRVSALEATSHSHGV
ncbi:MAG: phage baseplate assembly protein V [Roseovarius sp.]